MGAGGALPAVRSVLAVCAHPDDESFGLGGVLSALVAHGCSVSVLSFTHGEASTLGAGHGDLHRVREGELRSAAGALGVSKVRLLDYRDGALEAVPLERLAAEVKTMADEVGADLLVVFDRGGVTGHPDHSRSTEAALLAAESAGLAVLAWAVHRDVARRLNAELGACFVGRPGHEIDLSIRVDRREQVSAIRCHRSQSGENPVLWRRLELQGEVEALRWLRRREATGS